MILREYRKTVKRTIEGVKRRIRRRGFIIAIDETYEPVYGKIKNQWIHDYKMASKVLLAHTNTLRCLLYPGT